MEHLKTPCRNRRRRFDWQAKEVRGGAGSHWPSSNMQLFGLDLDQQGARDS